MLKSTVVFSLSLLLLSAAQSQTRIREFQKEYGTYAFSDPDPVPLQTALYPYFRYDGFTSRETRKKWKIVELENDFIRLQIFPEIGGKIWTAIEKSTGKPFLYNNDVVKFRDVAMRGPWTSGGLEANFGIIGHTPNCATPVDYMVRGNEDGSGSCIIGVFDLLSRSYWRMEIRLPKDKAVFSTRTVWYSTSPLEQPYYHWMNAGLRAGDDLELIYPGTQYIGHNGEHAPWPIDSSGHRLNWYRENNFGTYKSYHVFGENDDFSGAYYHGEQFGMVRYGAREEKAGTKLWIWGLSDQGMIWEKLLTDHSGQYVEMQSGRLFNQNTVKSGETPFKHMTFQPYATDSWTEYWYPVMNTGGISKAAEFGAVYVERSGNFLRFSINPNQELTDSLIIREANKVLYARKIALKTLQVMTDSIPLSGITEMSTVVFRMPVHAFSYSLDKGAGILARPLEAPGQFSWTSVYGTYVRGKEGLAVKDIAGAAAAFTACLQTDSNYLPALTAMSEVMYRKMNYSEAAVFAKKAISIDTHDGAANYYYGLAQEALHNRADAMDGFAIATLTPAWRSAAYNRLSRLQWQSQSYDRAIRSAQASLVTNAYNIEGLQLLAYYKRKSGHSALEPLRAIREIDPLNHFAASESDLSSSRSAFDSLSAGIRSELPVQSWLELASWYLDIGDEPAALSVLQAGPSNAETLLLSAFIQRKTLDASKLDINFIFPFRPILYEAIVWQRQQQDHWKLRYLQSLILREKNREKEALALVSGNDDGIDHAPYFVYRAQLSGKGAHLEDLLKAWTLGKDWRTLKAICIAYNEKQQVKKSLELLAPYLQKKPGDYIIGLLYAKTLLIDGQWKPAEKVLERLTVIPFEGATEGRELFREARLMGAVSSIRTRNYKMAVKCIGDSRAWPENLGVGKPYEEYIDDRLEQWLLYLCGKKAGKPDTSRLEKIAGYRNKIEKMAGSAYPSNEIVMLWAEKELNKSTYLKAPMSVEGDDSNKRILQALDKINL